MSAPPGAAGCCLQRSILAKTAVDMILSTESQKIDGDDGGGVVTELG